MRFLPRYNTFARPMARLLALLCAAFVVATANASDLPAVSDGEHLWLLRQTPPPQDDQDADSRLTLYHLPATTDRYIATKLDPITGELMPRGIAAGDGRLLIITKDRQLITIRPVWSELLRDSVYQKRTLTALPEGCTLVALTMSDRGPWALVKVQSRELLTQLDEQEKEQAGPTEQQLLNRALGFPDDFQLDKLADEPEPETPSEAGADSSGTDEASDESSAAETETETETETDTEAAPSVKPEPALPAFRLIHLRNRTWVRSPLPTNFEAPRGVELLIRDGDDRPTLLVDSDMGFRRIPSLVRYNPAAPDDSEIALSAPDAEVSTQAAAPVWERLVTERQLPPGRRWSADLVGGQIVIALESYRPREVASIETFRLRDAGSFKIGSANLPIGEDARWALVPKQNDIGLIASPAPPPAEDANPNALPTLAMLVGLSLDGDPLFQNEAGDAMLMPIAEKQPSVLDGNADLTIQIIAFIAAMFMMVMFYRRAPEQSQIDLPEHLVLASFGRRAMAGLIDLAPGFFLASLIYGVTVSEILFESWPGNGVEKAFAAMRPGFIVIGVTLLHTVICEFILARSLGKILTGLYVADLNGKPAPPAPCLGRALSRAFELFAPLMILVAIISPARQRLGDILAKTIVVMRKPQPFLPDEDDER